MNGLSICKTFVCLDYVKMNILSNKKPVYIVFGLPDIGKSSFCSKILNITSLDYVIDFSNLQKFLEKPQSSNDGTANEIISSSEPIPEESILLCLKKQFEEEELKYKGRSNPNQRFCH